MEESVHINYDTLEIIIKSYYIVIERWRVGKIERDRRTEREREMCFDKSCRWLPFEMDGIVTLICLWVCVRMFMRVGLCGCVCMYVCVWDWMFMMFKSDRRRRKMLGLSFAMGFIFHNINTSRIPIFLMNVLFFPNLIDLIWFDYLFLFPFSCFFLFFSLFLLVSPLFFEILV